MGTTIEKTIEIFEGMKKGISPWYPEEYYDKAIDIMKKYQEIEKIVKDWTDYNSFDSMLEIEGVLIGNDEK